jgi:hypothetical protein
MEPRVLRLIGAAGVYETRLRGGREHLVVPVVALMEGVLWPVNAKGREYVPLDVLTQNPAAWNGRPVMPDHPFDGQSMVSANDVELLDAQAFGTMFKTRVEGRQLVSEVWLDPEAAARSGAGALSVLQRVRDKQPVEVSVGAWVILEQTPGVFEGKPYMARWLGIMPDHLAMLPDGAQGACSVAMGCGVRGLRTHVLADGDFTLVGSADEEEKPVDAEAVVHSDEKTGWREKLMAPFKKFMGDYESLLKEVEEATVVVPDPDLKANADGETCGCHKEKVMHRNATRIKALIDNATSPWSADDQAYLETLTDDRLAAFEAAPVEVEKVVEKTVEVEKVVEKTVEVPKTLTQAEMLAQYPDIATIVDAHKAAQAAKHEALFNGLKGAQDAYSEADLKAMSIGELEKIEKLLASSSSVDYSGVGVPRANAQAESHLTPPDPWAAALTARKGA